ncbi:MAG: ATP-binding cassette domain-containing protein, partial [Lachnospiraceae bacterium]|nr:ATP-binding cassette domain-containing protein [Lachnospiraceae bacterium]
MEYILTADSLRRQYGHFKALDGLCMHIPKGAVYGLVGKNGAGKTTLIRLICGLLQPDSGEYVLYGIHSKSRDMIRARRRMGAVVETPALYSDMSAEENLKMQYRILG